MLIMELFIMVTDVCKKTNRVKNKARRVRIFPAQCHVI